MSSIFTKIVNGEIPAYKVAEDEDHLAFLDIQPLQPGHTLVIPKREVEYIFDLDDQSLRNLMTFTKKVAGGLKVAASGQRIGVSVIGLEVPHTHIHLIPINSVADMNFSAPKLELPESEMKYWMSRIKESIA